jgi:MFS family permease
MNADSEFRRGWPVVAAGLVGVACGASPVPYTLIGQLIGPMHTELGWSVGDISLAITLFGLAASFMAPYVGSLTDRIWLRPVALGSLIAFGLAFASLGLTPALVGAWWLAWLLAGLVSIGSGPLTWSRGVNLWFFRQRGLALGITLLGTSLTGVAVPLFAGRAIDAWGWRASFPLLALLPLAVALPVAWLLFREPRPDQRPAQIGGARGLTGARRSEALRDYRFWLIFGSVLFIALAYGGINVHLQQLLELQGFDRMTARGVVSSLAAAILLGRIGTGFLLDWIWAPLLALPVLCAPALACWLLSAGSLTLPLAYLCAGLVGLAAGAETDLIAYLAGRYFGMAHYGQIYGLLLVPFGVAAALSPALYGWSRDATGDYGLALNVATGLFLLGGGLLLALGRYPSFPAPAADP